MANGSGNAFKPRSPTASVAVTASAQTISPTYTSLNGYEPASGYLLTVVGTDPVYFLFGASPVVTAANGIALLPNSAQTFIGPDNSVVQCISSGTASTLYVTPGEGI